MTAWNEECQQMLCRQMALRPTSLLLPSMRWCYFRLFELSMTPGKGEIPKLKRH